MKHLYIHIPFCHRRCAYCDFNTYANMDDRMAAYVDALVAELGSRGEELGAGSRVAIPYTLNPKPSTLHTLNREALMPTVFLGGGTPTMLPPELMEQVLRAADTIVPLNNAEVTVEANPGTVLGRDYLRRLRDMGVNRISMGVQSLHNPTLKVLGRIHTAEEARQSFADAQQAGFKRINLDFIFGLPGQDVEQWGNTLDEIVTWGAEHFSLYSLILEESTPLYAQVTAGRVSVPDDDATGEMYEMAMARFADAGYRQYEISNWAKSQGSGLRGQESEPLVPEGACHHNLAYWLNADYLAAGAGAHGHVFPRRYFDILNIDDYIAASRRGELPTAEVTELTAHDLQVETMFMGLRLNIGVSYAHFRERCGVEMADVFGPTLDELAASGLLVRDNAGVRLTERGRMLGNQVFVKFV